MVTGNQSVVVASDVKAFPHMTLGQQNRCAVLGAGKIQESVINAQKKLIGIPFELSDQWRLADELNNLVAHQCPELLRGNPHDPLMTNDFCGSLGSAGQDRPLP